MITPSLYQTAIYDFVAASDIALKKRYGGKRNGIVRAVAGSGKTTTLVEAFNRSRGSGLFLAFNKPIAEELRRRGVNARTFHSLCFGPVMRFRKQGEVDKPKVKELVAASMDDDQHRIYGSFVARMLGFGRNAGLGTHLAPNSSDEWRRLIDHHDIEPESEEADLDEAISLCIEYLERCYAAPTIDFDDMLYLSVRDQIALPKFDFIFVDEAQDTNIIQREIIRKCCKPSTRIIAVGDPAQAIYGFRGADSESMQLIADEFDCLDLPLTISYRCPRAVVAYAKQWMDKIEHAPNASEGIVESLGSRWKPDLFRSGDLVVCRTTRPLVALAFRMLREHRPVRIMGQEIGKSLTVLIRKMRPRSLDHLVEKLALYSARECAKLLLRKEEAKAEALSDRCAAIATMAEGCSTLAELDAVIERLFADKGVATVLATIHKAKGLEADRVFWLNSSLCPSPWARQPWQQQQERNLCYVAATRAKQELYLIEEERK